MKFTWHMPDYTPEFVTHNEEEISTSQTHYLGTCSCSYSELCKVFGRPTHGDGYKVDVEWQIKFNCGEIATIYNWKNGPNYLGTDGVDPVSITEWNIGGHKQAARDKILHELERFKFMITKDRVREK